MNALNIITARVSPTSSASPSRSNSITSLALTQDEKKPRESENEHAKGLSAEPIPIDSSDDMLAQYEKSSSTITEETPLLSEAKEPGKRSQWWHSLPRNVAVGIIGSIRWVFATIVSPGVYLIACFYDEYGNFAPMTQLKKLFGVHKGNAKKLVKKDAQQAVENDSRARSAQLEKNGRRNTGARPSPSSGSSTESDSEESKTGRHHARSPSQHSEEDSNSNRRSIRIKLSSEEAIRERKHQRTQSQLARMKNSEGGHEDMLAQMKSPTSPASSLTKYPRTPAPPRPLIPRRQPSYLNVEPTQSQKKTLILDLDETLIHSMSKGGRMNSGHMVEVRLNSANLAPGQAGMSQHPILYWVNKRPYCDEFLRRVCKWFNLVVFTASVQEYADPVIDWLESERKFFSARYYRQHCTFRQGAYIKDLSSVEPDLSNVMILDNSPLSYLFHEGMWSQ